MAAPEWDWFQREELIGHISDIRVQNLQVERENVQKRTFTRWINLHLEKCDPPLEVKDLFVDIQDGKILMALLEVLSGRGLLHEYKPSSHRIFRLNNIAKALQFLEESSVKLVSIDAAEIADGNPSLVLGLIWNIIVFFQIKELTGNLSRNSPPSSLSPGSGGTDSDSSFPPTPTAETSGLSVKDQRKAIRTLLAWVQRKTRKYGVAVQDFTGSWRSGLAFLAVIKAIDPSLVDMKQALELPMRENLEKAFSVAQAALHIPRLLEPEDIMVDTPDEQSIVTYVAQFLERFPEVEPDEAVDSDREAPIESTFVRIKEARAERESQVLLVSENGEQTRTVSRETVHPRPSRVFVPDQAASVEESSPPDSSDSDMLMADSPPEIVDRVLCQVLSGVAGKDSSSGGSSSSEPLPEPSILSCRKENRRSSSLPIKKTVHFEADFYKDSSCSQDSLYSQSLSFQGSPPEARKPCPGWPPDTAPGLAARLAEEEEEERRPKPEVASDDVIPRDGSPVAAVDRLAQGSPSPPPWNGTASPGEESGSRSPARDSPVLAATLELKVPLLTTQALADEDGFEGIPLKASSFNSDLVDYACTSQQAFGDESAPLQQGRGAKEEEEDEEEEEEEEEREEEEDEEEEEPVEKPGKRIFKSAHKTPDPEEPAPEAPKAEVYEKAKCKSAGRWRHSLEDGSPREPGPPSGSASLETLQSRSQDGLDLKRSPPLSKISVIPHDLFYYPHYEVPLSAVLEAYAEGAEDVRNEEEEEQEEEEEGGLEALEARVQGRGVQDEDRTPDSDREPSLEGESDDDDDDDDDAPAPELAPPTPPTPPAAQPPSQAPESTPVETQQEPSDADQAAKPAEVKVTEESTSTKKKEKKKHVGCVDSVLFTVPQSGQSSEDLEEEASEYRVQSRTSHSDSSIYIRRHTNRSLESDHFSYVQLRNAADVDDRRNRMLNRKATSSGEAMAQEGQALRSDSLTQLVQQPDMMYFILFLWLLVYCLLLFPQLDVSRL
ncbi:calmin [Sorex araneus]|uniref:calmin n=1 Tax=Sorex araneus TaxID=42254 RepID=UPI002433558B|nr:calmin [Sorex araneus]